MRDVSVWDESPLPPPTAGTASAPPPSVPPSAPGGGPDDAPDPGRRVLGLPIWLAVVLGSVIGLAIAAAIVFSIGSGGGTTMPEATDGPTVTGGDPSTPVATDLPPSVPTTVPSTTVPSTTVASTTVASTTASTTTTNTTVASTGSPTTVAPTTITPTTITPTTVTPSTTPATTSPATTPATQVGPDGQRLTVTPRRGPCGAAPDCLVVSFTIDGFASRPETFVCEFASGRRFEFRFSGDGVDRACATNDVPDSIVVEVGGLRSDPVTNVG